MKTNFLSVLLCLLLFGHVAHAQYNAVQLIPAAGPVGEYDKIEFGLEIPQAVQDKINDFFSPTTYPTSNASSLINPYDPDEISIKVTISGPNNIHDEIYAFYYRDYVNNTSTNDWDEQQTNYPWRMRYAPKCAGHYEFTFDVEGPGFQSLTPAGTGEFDCVTSDNKGFLAIGSNKRYFVAQRQCDNSIESVFPMGVNMGWPEIFTDGTFRPSRYEDHIQKSSAAADAGMNYSRIWMIPQGYQIEWEIAGVYDRHPNYVSTPATSEYHPNDKLHVNRQFVMWELDRYLDMAHDKNLYVQLVLNAPDEDFNIPSNPMPWSWPNHPYRVKFGYSTTAVDFFFTNQSSWTAYKKRLRYIIARWGYSTNIAAFELINEVYQLYERFPSAYHGSNPQFNNDIATWLETMVQYVKAPTSSGGLDHEDHLFTVSIQPNEGNHVYYANGSNKNDDLATLPELDFISNHTYDMDKIQYEMFNGSDKLLNTYRKPTQVGEYGSGGGYGCGNNGLGHMDAMVDALFPNYHDAMWASCFTGGVTSAINNWSKGTWKFDSLRKHGREGYLQHFPPLQSFFRYEKMDQEEYYPERVVGHINGQDGTPLLQGYFLLNKGVYPPAVPSAVSDRALGYVHNSTYNFKRFLTNANSCSAFDSRLYDYYSKYVDGNCYQTTHGYPLPSNQLCPEWPGATPHVLTVPNLVPSTQFGVEWYYTDREWFDNYTTENSDWGIAQVDYISSDNNGDLQISPPPMGMPASTGQDNGLVHDYAVRIRAYRGDACASGHNDNLELGTTENNTTYKEVSLVNRCLSTTENMVIRTMNLQTTGQDANVNNGIDYFHGWLDAGDRLFMGDVDGDGKDEMVLVNTSYSDGAIMATKPKTRQLKKWINHDGTYVGWMDATDKMFLNDVDNDGMADLVLVNTAYNSGAIRVVDIMTGTTKNTINHLSTSQFTGFMDAGDRMYMAAVQLPGEAAARKMLVMVNTNYSDPDAVLVVDPLATQNSEIVSTIANNGLFTGWLDANDKMFVGDVDQTDNNEELVFVNEGYSSGFLLAIDLLDQNPNFTTPTFIFISNPSGGRYPGLNDYNDKLLLADMNGDDKKDLVMINQVSSDADPLGNNVIEVLDIHTNTTIFSVFGLTSTQFLDCNDKVAIGNVLGSSTNDILFYNTDANGTDAFLVVDPDNLSSPVTKYTYMYGNLDAWRDGQDRHTICHTEISGSERNAATGIVSMQIEGLKISPNPTEGLLDIVVPDNEAFDIKVLDVTGKILIEQKNNMQLKQIDLSGFDNGIYFMEVRSPDNSRCTIKKVVLSK